MTAEATKTKLIAIYTRKSNDENLGNNVTSLDSQKSCCRSYINIQQANGWQEYPEVFDDAAESGKSLQRPAIKRLLKCIAEGKVDGIIVYKLDRLTRNSKDFHYLLELFEKHNVAFISATESIDTKSPQGRLMTAIMVQFAQYDRELDQERSKDFHLSRAKKGLWCGGLPPLGYDSKDKLLVINEKEAELVRRIVGLYLQHQSTIKVAEELNRLGFRRKTYMTQKGKPYGGQPFDMDSVLRVLQRKVYIGFVRNERTKQEFPGQHTPIIEPAVFEQVQQLLASRNHRGGEVHYAANKYGFLLKGLIRCGECGNAITPYVRPKKGKVYLYYRCLEQNTGQGKKCAFTSIGARKLEEFIVEKLAALGWDRLFLEKVLTKAQKLAKQSIGPFEAEKRQLHEQYQRLEKQIQALLSVVKSGGASKEAAEELSKLEAAKTEITARIAQLEAIIAHRKQAVYDVDAVQGVFKRFALFINRIPVEMKVQIIRLMVEQVIVSNSQIEVRLHELPVGVLEKALDKRVVFGGGRLIGQQGAKTTLNKNCHREAVADFGQDWRGKHCILAASCEWRGRRDLNPRSLP